MVVGVACGARYGRRAMGNLTSSLGVLLCAGAAACSSGQQPVDASDSGADLSSPMDATVIDVPVVDVTPDYLRPPDVVRAATEATRTTERTACTFGAGSWPAETLGVEFPLGTDIPVDHVILLMMENRSFDHYFSQLPAAGQTDVTVAPAGWTNPNASGTAVPRMHDTTYCVEDTNHGWNGSHRQWNNGAMDGFLVTNDPGGDRSLAYQDATDIPFYYGLATTFAIADHYHCSLLGPTMPNRHYSMAATSFGFTYNTVLSNDSATNPLNNIFRRLDAAGLDWKEYSGGLRTLATFLYYGILRRQTAPHLATLAQLTSDMAAGTLPPFALVEPDFSGTGGDRYDEHPPGTPQAGEVWVESIVRALFASPAWSRTVLFITYDEHGGFADSVPPPRACPPDDLVPVRYDGDAGTNVPTGEAFDRLGFRVPFIVVSPYAKRHFVSHTTYDHTSILRFIEARFGLPAMTRRDANATPPFDMFDFQNPPFVTPPTLPAARGVDAALRSRCNTAFPNSGGL